MDNLIAKIPQLEAERDSARHQATEMKDKYEELLLRSQGLRASRGVTRNRLEDMSVKYYSAVDDLGVTLWPIAGPGNPWLTCTLTCKQAQGRKSYRREVEEQRRRCVEDNLKEAKMEMNRLRVRLLLNRYSGLNLSGYWTNSLVNKLSYFYFLQHYMLLQLFRFYVS